MPSEIEDKEQCGWTQRQETNTTSYYLTEVIYPFYSRMCVVLKDLNNLITCYLADMLTKGRNCNHLTQKVQICCNQCHDTTTIKHGQIILVDDGKVLKYKGQHYNLKS